MALRLVGKMVEMTGGTTVDQWADSRAESTVGYLAELWAEMWVVAKVCLLVDVKAARRADL
jgi:hypothetical protein